jgi:endonuclease/exonuclease/phosphatase family metal-dependent hydrolase
MAPDIHFALTEGIAHAAAEAAARPRPLHLDFITRKGVSVTMCSLRSFVVTFFAVVLAAGTVSAQRLPTGWSTKDVGAVAAAGSAKSVNNVFTVAGSGADVWGTADEFRFVYRQLTGNGSIVTQVTAVDNVNAWVKAGVMMRETLNANSKHAFMMVTPGRGLAFQRRATVGGSSVHTGGGAGTSRYYVKLERRGSQFIASKSVDGVSWTKVGSQSITMTPTIYVGLAVSSHLDGVTADATFSHTALAAATVARPTPNPNAATLRVLHWNVHHGGVGTDGKYDAKRIATWIARMNPDVASLNEVDTQSQVNAIVTALKAKTGTPWSVSFSRLGNLLISRLHISARSRCVYPDGQRYAAHLTTVVNNRTINIWSTHLTVNNASARNAEAKSLQVCAQNWSEARILAGDYNMQPGSSEYQTATVGYTDAWAAAKSLKVAINHSGNCDGCTRRSRIDYVFTSKTATFLTLKSAQVVDTRDAAGVMPSDHKPLVVVYEIR